MIDNFEKGKLLLKWKVIYEKGRKIAQKIQKLLKNGR